MDLFIGVSGWTYDSWKGRFYPDGLSKAKWLEYYAERFSTVEVNATFYRTMKPGVFEKWRSRTPPDFRWSVKASRYITHVKRLKDPEETVQRFLEPVRLLEEKLGPVLFQLPPNLPLDLEVAEKFVKSLPKDIRCVLEPRHETWFCESVYSMLREHNIAWCVSDTAGKHPCVRTVTADFAYLRLHGSTVLYESEYTEEELQSWADDISSWGLDAYVYFDNTMKDGAVKNARRLKEIFSI